MNFNQGYPLPQQMPRTTPRLTVGRALMTSEVQQALWVLAEWLVHIDPANAESYAEKYDLTLDRPGIPGLDFEGSPEEFAEVVMRLANEFGMIGRSLCHLAELLETSY